jgi:quercetin dioxygenase-like cupin family protein
MSMASGNRRLFLQRLGVAAAGTLVLSADSLRADAPAAFKRPAKRVAAGEGRALWWMGDDRFTFQATTEETAGAYAFWIDEPPAEVGPPRHVHSREEEGFYVLEGEVTFQAGAVRSVAKPGTFLALPAGVPHGWKNGSTKAKLITFTSPAGNEGFFFDLGRPGTESPGPRATMPLDEINRRGKRYGVTYLQPSSDPMAGALASGLHRTAAVVLPGKGEGLRAAGTTYTIKAAGKTTADSYTLTEQELAPGRSVPAHRHSRYEEGVYVLAGTVAATVDGRAFRLAAGDFLIVPWGLTHELKNETTHPARLLSLTTPGGIEKYYRAACRPADAPPAADANEDLKRLRTVGDDYGIFAG